MTNSLEALDTLGISLSEVPVHGLASFILADWSTQGKGVSPYAKPYLDAMFSLESVNDAYFADSGRSVVLYFLSNASSWKGETAKAIKAELKRRVK